MISSARQQPTWHSKLRPVLRKLKYHVLNYSGVAPAYRLLGGRKFSILMYHGVTDKALPLRCWMQVAQDQFVEQMDHVAQQYTVWPLRKIIAAVEAEEALPANCMAITFDDGYRNVFSTAFPVLAERMLPATVFLTTGPMAAGTHLWTDKLYAWVAQSQCPTLDLRGYGLPELPLATIQHRTSALAELSQWLKEVPNAQREHSLQHVSQLLGAADVQPIDVFDLLTPTQLHTMRQEPLLDLCAHTVNHPILSRCSRATQATEIEQSINWVVQHCNSDGGGFAYPNGRACDFNANSVALVKSSGLRYAVTTVEGRNASRQVDRYRLKRKGIGSDMSLPHFKYVLAR